MKEPTHQICGTCGDDCVFIRPKVGETSRRIICPTCTAETLDAVYRACLDARLMEQERRTTVAALSVAG